MIEGFITLRVGDCAALDTDGGRTNLARGILALALDQRTEEIPADQLLKYYEDEKSIFVRVSVQCGSNLSKARMLSDTQATIQYNLMGLSTETVDDMRTMMDIMSVATALDFNLFLKAWGGEVVRTAGIDVLSITPALAGQDEFCPGTPYCSGHGTCNRTIPENLGDPSWECICDMTYTGPICTTRV